MIRPIKVEKPICLFRIDFHMAHLLCFLRPQRRRIVTVHSFRLRNYTRRRSLFSPVHSLYRCINLSEKVKIIKWVLKKAGARARSLCWFFSTVVKTFHVYKLIGVAQQKALSRIFLFVFLNRSCVTNRVVLMPRWRGLFSSSGRNSCLSSTFTRWENENACTLVGSKCN